MNPIDRLNPIQIDFVIASTQSNPNEFVNAPYLIYLLFLPAPMVPAIQSGDQTPVLEFFKHKTSIEYLSLMGKVNGVLCVSEADIQ